MTTDLIRTELGCSENGAVLVLSRSLLESRSTQQGEECPAAVKAGNLPVMVRRVWTLGAACNAVAFLCVDVDCLYMEKTMVATFRQIVDTLQIVVQNEGFNARLFCRVLTVVGDTASGVLI